MHVRGRPAAAPLSSVRRAGRGGMRGAATGSARRAARGRDLV